MSMVARKCQSGLQAWQRPTDFGWLHILLCISLLSDVPLMDILFMFTLYHGVLIVTSIGCCLYITIDCYIYLMLFVHYHWLLHLSDAVCTLPLIVTSIWCCLYITMSFVYTIWSINIYFTPALCCVTFLNTKGHLCAAWCICSQEVGDTTASACLVGMRV